MKPWHWSRIRVIIRDEYHAPCFAANGDWVSFWISVRNSDPKSAFRCTNWPCETLGL